MNFLFRHLFHLFGLRFRELRGRRVELGQLDSAENQRPLLKVMLLDIISSRRNAVLKPCYAPEKTLYKIHFLIAVAV